MPVNWKSHTYIKKTFACHSLPFLSPLQDILAWTLSNCLSGYLQCVCCDSNGKSDIGSSSPLSVAASVGPLMSYSFVPVFIPISKALKRQRPLSPNLQIFRKFVLASCHWLLSSESEYLLHQQIRLRRNLVFFFQWLWGLVELSKALLLSAPGSPTSSFLSNHWT